MILFQLLGEKRSCEVAIQEKYTTIQIENAKTLYFLYWTHKRTVKKKLNIQIYMLLGAKLCWSSKSLKHIKIQRNIPMLL